MTGLPRALCVLVADDDHETLATLAALIGDRGHEVHACQRASEVIDAVREYAPDVVLLDINMPDINGYDVAREINARYGRNRPRLIAVTGWKQAADRVLAYAAGFDHHIAKPYDIAELLELVRSREPG